MATLDEILNLSFREEQNKFNNRKIKNTESGNVDKLFIESDTKKVECNICYQEDILAIQCYQCSFMYCKICLEKIISEYNKCSSCQCDYKNNYNITIKNENIIKISL